MTRGDFSKQAEAYGRSRPSYPTELIELSFQDAGLKTSDPVADLGAGTGIFTRALVEHGFLASAVEPNAEMRRQADCPQARWIDGSFEATTLPDQSQSWVVAAQAFHWADPIRALPELRRILQPRRLFTAIWNVKAMDGNPTLRWTADAIERCCPGFRDAYDGTDWPTVLESTGDFEFVGSRSVRHSQPMSPTRFVALWKSHHWLQRSANPEAFAAFIAELQSHLAASSVGEVDVVYDCTAYSARRRD